MNGPTPPNLHPAPHAASSNRPRRETDNQLLAKWGYDPSAPQDVVDMAQLSLSLVTMRAGAAVAHLGFADTDTIEEYLATKPSDMQVLEYLATKLEGLRPEVQRILALQDSMPYYRQLGPAHASLSDNNVVKACTKLEATLVSTPTGEPCLVFTEHNNARRYASMGRQEQMQDPIRLHLRRMPILAVGARSAVLARLTHEYSATGALEQTYITPATATTETQKQLIRILEEAVARRASNIAIQPDVNGMTMIRLRIDGAMVPLKMPRSIPPDVATEMANILHTWSNATYTGKKDLVQGQLQGPAGGQFTFRTTDAETFVRSSFTKPDSLGGPQLESISLRILPRENIHVRFTDLNMKPDVIEVLDDALHEQRGIILFVGSTSSGKSTAAHGAQEHYQTIHGRSVNCLALEDPVERLAPGLIAHSISRDYGFDLIMAELLRQDPDLIFLGEMRDRSSASTGIRAANSGHIVLSTLHADNSLLAIGALRAYISNRVVDNAAAVMVTDFDLVHSINLIVAQQLAPALCECKLPTTKEVQADFAARIIRYAEKHGILPRATEANHATQRLAILNDLANTIRASYQRNPQGCSACDGLGTIGKLPINECFVPDARCKQQMVDMLATNRLNLDLLKPFRTRTLFQSALERVRDGETALDTLYV